MLTRNWILSLSKQRMTKKQKKNKFAPTFVFFVLWRHTLKKQNLYFYQIYNSNGNLSIYIYRFLSFISFHRISCVCVCKWIIVNTLPVHLTLYQTKYDNISLHLVIECVISRIHFTFKKTEDRNIFSSKHNMNIIILPTASVRMVK